MYLTQKQITNDLKTNDICIYISDRAGRKTSAIQDFLLKEWKKNKYNPVFAFFRSKTDENITDSWFSDYVRKKYKQYDFFTKKIDKYIYAICAKIDDEEKILCFNFFISVSQKYKSTFYNGFEYIKYIIWEECIPERRIPQSIDIVEKSDDEINQVFSIASSVCRYNKPKFIFIGNDIEYNFVNIITVKFNLLDKIVVDKVITGETFLYNDKYKFLFLYFSFKGSVNHWEDLTDLSLSKNKEPTGKLQKVGLILNDIKYYIYDNDSFLVITNINNYEEIEERKFLKQFFSDKVCNQYFVLNKENKQLFLEILRFRNPEFSSIFNQYYYKIEYNNIYVYEFQKPKNEEITFYDINSIFNLNYEELLNSCDKLYEFFHGQLLKKCLFSNYGIQINTEKLKELLVKTFINKKI